MRTTLIIIQAAILSIVVVLGAQGESDHRHSCPLPSAQADKSCQE